MKEAADDDKLKKAKAKHEEGEEMSREVTKENMQKPLYTYSPYVPYP